MEIIVPCETIQNVPNAEIFFINAFPSTVVSPDKSQVNLTELSCLTKAAATGMSKRSKH